MATMRTPPKAVAEIKAKDPECPITVSALRRWLKAGKVRSAKIGKTFLCNMESLEEYLTTGE